MSGFSIRIEGIEELKAKLGPERLGEAIKVGLRRGAAIVEEAAQNNVHSPDNPWTEGKAGYSVATGKLQAAIGQSKIRGRGLDLSVAVGTSYGKGGGKNFRFSRSVPVVINGKLHKRGRTGARYKIGPRGGIKTIGGVNKANPQVYGPIEERRHPFLDPALKSNEGRIQDAMEQALIDEFRRGLK